MRNTKLFSFSYHVGPDGITVYCIRGYLKDSDFDYGTLRRIWFLFHKASPALQAERRDENNFSPRKYVYVHAACVWLICLLRFRSGIRFFPGAACDYIHGSPDYPVLGFLKREILAVENVLFL